MSLLADLNSTTAGSSALPPVTLGSFAYFGADDGIHGFDLWRTDGTLAGTSLVKDIGAGTGGGILDQPRRAGGLLYFSAYENQGISHIELWRSDGTANGTIRLTNTASGTQLYGDVMTLGGVDIIATSNGVFRSDGTVAGTYQIASLAAASTAQLGSSLYFLGSPLAGGAASLWKTDGTAAGTSLVRSFSQTYTTNIQALNGRLYFWASDSALNTGVEPWSSDGTAAGTVPLGDLAAGSASSTPGSLAAFNGAIYFIASTDTNGNLPSLFRTDGSAGSATIVASLGTQNGSISSQPALTVYHNALYLRGSLNNSGAELLRSDGTLGGTQVVTDLYPGTNGSFPSAFQIYNDRLYFEARSPTVGVELFSTDGTAAGTTLLKDIAPGAAGIDSVSRELLPAIFNGRLFFRANDVQHGSELWSSDGTSAGTSLLVDLNTHTNNADPGALTLGPGGADYFAASDGVHGQGLFRTDGTTAGTIELASGLSGIASLAYANGLLFFQALDAVGLELWRSDGTTAGTARVIDLAPGSASGLTSGSPIVAVGNRVYFAAAPDDTNPAGLWTSDGSAAGTQPVLAGSASFSAVEFTGVAFNGKLIFSAYRNGLGIFTTDGTAAGTTRLLTGLGEHATLINPVILNGRLYFKYSSVDVETQIFSTDGSLAGTTAVTNIDSASGSSVIGSLIAAGNTLYYTEADQGVGTQLWRIDPSNGAPTRLTTLPSSTSIMDLRASAAGGVLFTSNNRNIYRYDGVSLITVASGFAAVPTLLGPAFGIDYFSGNTAASGAELWMTDGTAAGTVLVKDLYPGATSSSPQNLTTVNGNAVFSALDPQVGRELFVFSPFARLNADGSLTLEGTQSADQLSLSVSSGNVVASLFGASLTFTQATISHRVHVISDGGNDTINVLSRIFDFVDDLGTTAPGATVVIATGAEANFDVTQHLGALNVSGLARLPAGSGTTLATGALSVLSGGTLDINDNAAIVDYTGASPVAALADAVSRGYASGAWTGAGITSTLAANVAADSSKTPKTVVGFGEAADLGFSAGGVFAGQTIDGTSLLFRYTLTADANLDRIVNIKDLGIFATNWQGTSKTFSQGDFTYDGKVDVADLGILATNWQKSLASPTAPLVHASAAAELLPQVRSGHVRHLLDELQ